MEMMTDDEIDVLVVDPVYLCMPADDVNNIMAQGARLRRINDTCQEVGVTVLLAHHTKKTGKPDNRDLFHVATLHRQTRVMDWGFGMFYRIVVERKRLGDEQTLRLIRKR